MLTYNYPALGDGISSNFHADFFSTNNAMNEAYLKRNDQAAAPTPLKNRCAANFVFSRS
jgi:hypothetical protein